MLCTSCQSPADGSFSKKEGRFYCRDCWRMYPNEDRCPCSVCGKRAWSRGASMKQFSCKQCKTTATREPPADTSTVVASTTTAKTGTKCLQCKQFSVSGFPSSSQNLAFFCTNCWKGFRVSDRSPCSLCHQAVPGYVYSKNGSTTQGEFLCSSCIGVFEKRRTEDLTLQRQRDDDAALLVEPIDFATLMARPGCKFIDDWIVRTLSLLQLRDQDVARDAQVVSDARAALAPLGLTVEIYGSRRTGLAITNSDFDFFVHPRGDSAATSDKDGNDALPPAHDGGTPAAGCSTRRRIDAVANALRVALCASADDKGLFSDVAVIHARVPIVRCVHRSTSYSLDFSFNPVGILGSHFLCDQLQRRELAPARPLIVSVKLFLKSWSLEDANAGGLGSFAVAMMVLWFLKQPEASVAKRLDGDSSPAVLLMNFFNYYGNIFDAKSKGIDVLEGKLLSNRSKYCKHPGGICLRHPIDRDTNAANGCDLFHSSIQPKFREAHVALNHLARMKYVMTTSDVYDAADKLLFQPVKGLLKRRQTNSHVPSEPLRAQNKWTPAEKLYCGGLLFVATDC